MDRRSFLKGLLATGVVTLVAPTLPTLPAPIRTKQIMSFEQIAITTLNKYRPIFADNILNSHRFEYLKKRYFKPGLKT